MKYRLGLIAASFLLLALTPFSKASAEDAWVFHLERNGDKITLDASVSKTIAKIDDPAFSLLGFSKSTHAGPYSLDMFDVSGAKAVSTHFDIPQGKNSFEVPYFSIVNRFQLTLVKTGAVLLEGSLADFVTCNANGICEYEKGENINTCLSDCASGKVEFSPETKTLLDKSGGTIKNPNTGETQLRDYTPVGMPPQPTDVAPTQPVSTTTQDNSRIFVLVVGSLGAIAIVAFAFWIIRRRR
ncbi:MAG: transmembrane domain-containing protein [Candidatus Moraniibacteriota bacterium]